MEANPLRLVSGFVELKSFTTFAVAKLSKAIRTLNNQYLVFTKLSGVNDLTFFCFC